jgi:hypothetical protein
MLLAVKEQKFAQGRKRFSPARKGRKMRMRQKQPQVFDSDVRKCAKILAQDDMVSGLWGENKRRPCKKQVQRQKHIPAG